MNGLIGFIFITSLLASGRGDPVRCEVTRRFARLSDTYTVYFTTCHDPNEVYAPSCRCPDSQNITNAWFWRDDEKQFLKHNSSSFWVTSSELHIHTGGRHWFNFEYSYRCHSHTLCKQGHISLELRVANFHLRTLNTSSTKHARGSNVWFLCSSHLNDSHTVEVRFHFISHNGRTLHASCPANKSKTIHHNGHWLIYRDHETHDCILEIRNVIEDADAGEYRCDGSLPVHGRIEYAWSNTENITVYQNESSPSSAKHNDEGSIIGIAIATGFVVLLLLVAGVRVCVMICRPPPPPPPLVNPPPPPPQPPLVNPPPANPPPANPPALNPAPRNDHPDLAAVLLVDPHNACGSGGSGDEAEPLLRPRDPPLGRSSGARATPKEPKSYEALDTKGSRKKTKQWTDHSLQIPTIEGPPMTQDNLTGHSSPAISPEQDPAHLSFTFNDEPSTKESSSGKTSSKGTSPPISPGRDPAHLSFILNEESSNKDSGSESTDSSKEKLHGSFTTEAAVEYVKSQNDPPSHTPESDAPFDPNLQCQKCGRKYREGQIQPYKKHTNECVGN